MNNLFDIHRAVPADAADEYEPQMTQMAQIRQRWGR